jgi:NAD(P)-dependent dehydrogenase (short-subunit alcohol dehydrogenase family)
MSNQTLAGKFAVVTGGTKGIGLAISRAFVNAGASVAVCARSQPPIDNLLRELSPQSKGLVIGKTADVGNSDSVTEFFRFVEERFGGLDLLVNNAGVGTFRSVADLTIEEWNTILRTNLDGVFYCSHAAIPLLQKRGGGAVVNISSLAGKNAFAGGAAYNASKFGLNGFSEAMMLDLRNDNIRVSYVMPGSVNTGFGSHAENAQWKIDPEDVASVVMGIISMPERTTISRVELRPSKPPK